jgi:hypothetical protein
MNAKKKKTYKEFWSELELEPLLADDHGISQNFTRILTEVPVGKADEFKKEKLDIISAGR